MKTPYTAAIAAIAPEHDPRHVEAYMRAGHGTLDHLRPAAFRAEVDLACACIVEGGYDMAERVAQSYGL